MNLLKSTLLFLINIIAIVIISAFENIEFNLTPYQLVVIACLSTIESKVWFD